MKSLGRSSWIVVNVVGLFNSPETVAAWVARLAGASGPGYTNQGGGEEKRGMRACGIYKQDERGGGEARLHSTRRMDIERRVEYGQETAPACPYM